MKAGLGKRGPAVPEGLAPGWSQGDTRFLARVASMPGGEKLAACIQCGTCTGSCPVSWKMQHTPRRLIEMVRAGMEDEVLASDTIWYCASCYSCSVRCPRGINLTDLMYLLRSMAMERRARGTSVAFYRSFSDMVLSFGRLYEGGLMLKTALRTNLLSLLPLLPFAVRLWLRGKLKILPPGMSSRAEIRKLHRVAQGLEGAE
ncbi:MAG: 4Fe-4S dicluster domain-containing protein [Acetobacteraceae bacterium]|nr:4Fe-4S dicluster domain-containing protein [Acetobacteraceae bacterium]